MFQPCPFHPLQARATRRISCLLRLLAGLFTTLGLPLAAAAQTAAAPAAISAVPQTHQQGFIVPFTPVPGQGAPLITVRLNGSEDATFIVDTGTGNCLISQALAAKLGALPYAALLPDGKPLLLNGKQPQAITLTSLQIGGKSGPLIIKPLSGPVLVVPEEQLRVSVDRTVDGLIGSNLLDAYAVIFDFPGRTMTLCSPGNLTPGEARYLGFDGVAGTVTTLSCNADETYSTPVRLENGKVSRQADLLVDTGAQRTLIPRLVAQDLSLVPLRQRPVVNSTDNYTANEAQVKALGLGELRIANPFVLYAAKGDHITGLGLDILSGYKMLLDFPARKMYIQAAVPSLNIKSSENIKPTGAKTTAP